MTEQLIGAMDETDGRLLNAMQEEFPVTERPYAALGENLGLPESEVLERVARLREDGVIRQVSPIWDTRSIGYHSTLVAARVAPRRRDEAAAIINTHPGVTHNYARDHRYNLWFTLAVPPGGDLAWCVERLGRLAGAESIRMLPALRVFKIGVTLDMTGQRSADDRAEPEYAEGETQSLSPLCAGDIDVIRATQDDLPAVPEPFGPIADSLGVSQPDLFADLSRLRREGYLRRVAAILRHRRAGFGANAMVAWAVTPERAADAGRTMAGFRVVTHCYQRPVYEDWPYGLFTMIHGREATDCTSAIEAIRLATGIEDHATLYSTKEYRKVRLRYFTPDLDGWEAAQRSLAGCVP